MFLIEEGKVVHLQRARSPFLQKNIPQFECARRIAPIMITPIAPPDIRVNRFPITPETEPPRIMPSPAKTAPHATIRAVA